MEVDMQERQAHSILLGKDPILAAWDGRTRGGKILTI